MEDEERRIKTQHILDEVGLSMGAHPMSELISDKMDWEALGTKIYGILGV